MRRRTTGSSSRPSVRASVTRSSTPRCARHHALDPQRAALVGERAHRDPPAVVQLADEVRLRHDDVGEEHLGELGSARDVAQRPDLDAGRVEVDDQHRDALVLRHVGIGADVAEALRRDHGVARPDLLPVDDEAVAVVHGPGRQVGEVATRRSARTCRRTTPCRRGWRPAPSPSAPRCRTRAATARRWRTHRSGPTAGCPSRPSPRGRRASGSAWRCGRRARAGSRGSSSRGRTGWPATSRAHVRDDHDRRRSSVSSSSPIQSRPRRDLGRRVLVDERRAARRGTPRRAGSKPSFTGRSHPLRRRVRGRGRPAARRRRTPGPRRRSARGSRRAGRPTESSVHGLSSVTSVSGRQPSSSCNWPPCTFTTWPRDALRLVRREPAGDGGDVGRVEAVEPRLVGLHVVAGDGLR